MKNLKLFIKKLLSKILPAFESYCRLSALFFLLLLLTGSYEIMAGVFSKVEKLPFLPVAGSVLLNYLFYLSRTFIILLIPYLLIYILSKKWASFFFIFFATVLLLLQLALVQYFNKSMVPLGADLFAYSIADIKQTLGASGGVSILQIVAFIFLMLFPYWCLFTFQKKFASIGILLL